MIYFWPDLFIALVILAILVYRDAKKEKREEAEIQAMIDALPDD